MRRSKEIVVCKRDRSVECFSPSKLSVCLARGLQARNYDPRLARPLVRAVAMHLQECSDIAPPTTQYIFRCVCSVLQQTGLADVAEDLHRYRRRRAGGRRRVRVVDTGAGPGARGEPWRKLALVATLQNRYGCRHAVARILAGQIETRVLGLNYRLITKQFIVELMRNEVLAWGLADQQVLGAHIVSADPVATPPQKET